MTAHISCIVCHKSDYKFQDGGQNSGCARQSNSIHRVNKGIAIWRKWFARFNDVWLVGTTWWQGCGELLLQDNCFCKAMAVSQAFIFNFKCYSILHFTVWQLLCWAFLFMCLHGDKTTSGLKPLKSIQVTTAGTTDVLWTAWSVTRAFWTGSLSLSGFLVIMALGRVWAPASLVIVALGRVSAPGSLVIVTLGRVWVPESLVIEALGRVLAPGLEYQHQGLLS